MKKLHTGSWKKEEDGRLRRLLQRGHSRQICALRLKRSYRSVCERVHHLGLTNIAIANDPLARPRARPSQHKIRNCLCCKQRFRSEGPHNRLCAKCRRLDAGTEPVMLHRPTTKRCCGQP